MRMSQDGPSARDLVNGEDEERLADILFLYGEERASRRIARRIVEARPVETTGELAALVASCLPRPKPGQSHPATRTFQALRIAVNDEYGELARGLEAAERALRPGGLLAVVTFHSIEDRMVKRFLQLRSGKAGGGNRWAPEAEAEAPGFEIVTKKAVEPGRGGDAGQPARALGAAAGGATDGGARGAHQDEEIGMPILAETAARTGGGRRAMRGTR
jgi:16S rRNA (cytosine1402-N4)-methyltransferase